LEQYKQHCRYNTNSGWNRQNYDKKFKETKNMISEYESWSAHDGDTYININININMSNINMSNTFVSYEYTINNNFKFLPKIANYNLKLVVEVVRDSSTEQGVINLLETALGSTDLKKANQKAL